MIPDIEAANGVMHIIDAVLMPEKDNDEDGDDHDFTGNVMWLTR